MKKIILKILFCCLFLIIFSQANYCLAADGDESDSTSPSLLNLEVPIFDYSQSSGLPEYIATLFKYAMIVLIPLAIIMVILGGISWIAAAGNPQKIKAAQSQIFSAILGLILGLLTYTLLSFVGINSLTMRGVQSIQPEIGDDLLIYETNSTLPGSPGSYPSVGGQCFPVAANSFVSNSNNFKANRSGGGRYHAGVDLITKEPAYGVAMADGVVTAVTTTFKGKSPCGPKDGCCSKGWFAEKYGPKPAGKIMIYFPSLDVTANYGEIDNTTNKLSVGSSVTAGQILGVFGPCRMVHFELYKGKTSNSTPWYQGNAQPASLLDPTNTLSSLQSKMCGN